MLGGPDVLGLLVDVIEDDETGLVAVAELAARIRWDAKRSGEALTAASVECPKARRQRVNGSPNPVPVVEIDAIKAAINRY
ncbi:hypothetical protein ACWEFJ_04205 [Actinosynnema sp. NPDC004786]